jgi:hypothetical protein
VEAVLAPRQQEQAVSRAGDLAEGAEEAAADLDTKQRLNYISRLLQGRLTLAQHRELLVTIGWLALLLGAPGAFLSDHFSPTPSPSVRAHWRRGGREDDIGPQVKLVEVVRTGEPAVSCEDVAQPEPGYIGPPQRHQLRSLGNLAPQQPLPGSGDLLFLSGQVLIGKARNTGQDRRRGKVSIVQYHVCPPQLELHPGREFGSTAAHPGRANFDPNQLRELSFIQHQSPAGQHRAELPCLLEAHIRE